MTGKVTHPLVHVGSARIATPLERVVAPDPQPLGVLQGIGRSLLGEPMLGEPIGCHIWLPLLPTLQTCWCMSHMPDSTSFV